jgi:hypothetical protein
MRELIYKVCYINLADIVVTLFEDRNKEVAENFAKNYDGGEKELFIKPVYRLVGTRQYSGSEL